MAVPYNQQEGSNLFTPSIVANVKIALSDATGFAVLVETTGAPPTTANKFQLGCIAIRTDGSGSNVIYFNTGTIAVPSWTALGSIPVGDIVLAARNILVGNAAGAATAVAVSGDATIDTLGAVQVQGISTTAAIVVGAAGSTQTITIGQATAPATVAIGNSAGSIITLGGTATTQTITVGQAAVTQTITVGSGTGTLTVGVGNSVSGSGNTVNIETGATAATGIDIVNIDTGNAVALGKKQVNIATGTPGTNGNNQVMIGGTVAGTLVTFKATPSAYQVINYATGVGGLSNAITATVLDASGASVSLAAGVGIVILLGGTLALAGLSASNTVNFNSLGTKNIRSHFNTANGITTGYTAGGVVSLIYDGTQWLDTSQ